MKLSNRTILITGGTSGIGLELAEQFLLMNNTVIVTGRDEIKLKQTKELLPSVHVYQSDVSKPEQIILLHQTLTTQFPQLDIIINNAAEMRKINLHNEAIDADEIVTEIDTNLSGPVRIVQQFLPHLKTKNEAAIINISSAVALVPFPVAPVYSATKAGLHFYTKSLRAQMKKTSIKVFEVLPPAVNTSLLDKFSSDIHPALLTTTGKLAKTIIKGLQNNKYEIYPGYSKAVRLLSKIIPNLMFKQLSKPVKRMMNTY